LIEVVEAPRGLPIETFAGSGPSPAREGASPSPTLLSAVPLATVHALVWLTVACGIGLLMSLLLLFPGLNAALGPLTYGRWAPLHLDLVLYGWLALPLVALLLRACKPQDRAAGWAVQIWSGSLVAGAASWLLGRTNGKAFLDWQGIARVAFLANLAFLAVVLAAGLVRRKGERPWGLAALWVGLLGVAAMMASATSSRTYPPINPATGGPTGASLLGSTLAVIAIFLGTPYLLGFRGGSPGIFLAFGVHVAFFAFVGLGEQTHREPLQIAAVVSLLIWAWLLPRWLGRFDWPAGSRPWLLAFLAWGGVLLASAVPMFLPGLLDRIKFTNALVGHAHLAMAGLATSFAALLLTVLNRDTVLRGLFADRAAFVLWHAGNAAHVAVLAGAGALESADPGIVFRGDLSITVLYAMRAAAGAAMLLAAARWSGGAVRRFAP
jgi:cytochrome c oxidase cbb3-type subunit 1